MASSTSNNIWLFHIVCCAFILLCLSAWQIQSDIITMMEIDPINTKHCDEYNSDYGGRDNGITKERETHWSLVCFCVWEFLLTIRLMYEKLQSQQWSGNDLGLWAHKTSLVMLFPVLAQCCHLEQCKSLPSGIFCKWYFDKPTANRLSYRWFLKMAKKAVMKNFYIGQPLQPCCKLSVFFS